MEMQLVVEKMDGKSCKTIYRVISSSSKKVNENQTAKRFYSLLVGIMVRTVGWCQVS